MGIIWKCKLIYVPVGGVMVQSSKSTCNDLFTGCNVEEDLKTGLLFISL